MRVYLRPETEARLTALASASGVSADDYLAALVERELPGDEAGTLLEEKTGPNATAPLDEASGMVEENGLRVYRTGKPMPLELVNEACPSFP